MTLASTLHYMCQPAFTPLRPLNPTTFSFDLTTVEFLFPEPLFPLEDDVPLELLAPDDLAVLKTLTTFFLPLKFGAALPPGLATEVLLSATGFPRPRPSEVLLATTGLPRPRPSDDFADVALPLFFKLENLTVFSFLSFCLFMFDLARSLLILSTETDSKLSFFAMASSMRAANIESFLAIKLVTFPITMGKK
ncbi:hypothetical protein CASFOL_034703 [Castilleja foliolosa]|uniref:Uncharacterized protein n=1 Tax=Castilleja foliolosa TaxID=1961234 RepID=A0ABD3BQL2_9LAMI